MNFFLIANGSCFAAASFLREYSTVGSASLMTDLTDRLASTVINLVLPDKVCNGMPKGLGIMLSFAACRGKRLDSGLAFPSLQG